MASRLAQLWRLRQLGLGRATTRTSPPPAPPSRAMSAATTSGLSGLRREPLSLGTQLYGRSGRQYTLMQILSHRERPFICVYLAKDTEGHKHVLKTIFKSEFDYQLGLQKPLADCPYLRVVADDIQEHQLFTYNYLSDDLLNAARRKDLTPTVRKRILRDALRGLAELHSRGIVHTDIKANNILVDITETPGIAATVKKVQISDLESAADPPPGKSIKGPLLGNHMWRSPEAHVREKVNTPSDVFSFGIVCIYVMLDVLVFQLPDGFPAEDETKTAEYVLEKQFSYFADDAGVTGLRAHVSPDSPWQAKFMDIMARLCEEDNPPRPFVAWAHAQDAEFRDVVSKMTRLGPEQRITAAEALEHPWFRNIE